MRRLPRNSSNSPVAQAHGRTEPGTTSPAGSPCSEYPSVRAPNQGLSSPGEYESNHFCALSAVTIVLVSFVREGPESGVWRDEIAPNVVAQSSPYQPSLQRACPASSRGYRVILRSPNRRAARAKEGCCLSKECDHGKAPHMHQPPGYKLDPIARISYATPSEAIENRQSLRRLLTPDHVVLHHVV
jgi:hypothetical protein